MNDGNKSELAKTKPHTSRQVASQATAELMQGKIIQVQEHDQGEALSESVLFRCGRSVFKEIDFVFRHSTARSKQKLLESIIVPRLRTLSQEIRGESSNPAESKTDASLTKSIPVTESAVKKPAPEKKYMWIGLLIGFLILLILNSFTFWELGNTNGKQEQLLVEVKQQKESVRLQLQVIQDTLQYEVTRHDAKREVAPLSGANSEEVTVLRPRKAQESRDKAAHLKPGASMSAAVSRISLAGSKKRKIKMPVHSLEKPMSSSLQRNKPLFMENLTTGINTHNEEVGLAIDPDLQVQSKVDESVLDVLKKDNSSLTLIDNSVTVGISSLPLESADSQRAGSPSQIITDNANGHVDSVLPEAVGMTELKTSAPTVSLDSKGDTAQIPLESSELVNDSPAEQEDSISSTGFSVLDGSDSAVTPVEPQPNWVAE